jgi:hypothetical protein
MSSTDARLFRAALFDACVTLFAADTDPYTLVVRGLPSFANAQDVVAVGAVTTSQEFATFSSSARTREETLTCQIDFYSFRPGGDAMEEVVEARAWEMLDAVAEYVRVTNTELKSDAYPSGIVRHCFLSDAASDAATDPDVLAKGRMHVISATFTAQNRVRSA